MKLRWHLYVLPFVFTIITFYFTFHLVQGERGIFRLFEVNREISRGEILLSEKNTEKEQIEKRIESLSQQKVEADMLDEEARRQFGVILSEEYVIYD